MDERASEPIPNSPIAGQDDMPVMVGATELRRARANVEIYYLAAPGEFVDIQARIHDALEEADLGNVLPTVDLTEHVRFVP
jgi:hypothetical protein